MERDYRFEKLYLTAQRSIELMPAIVILLRQKEAMVLKDNTEIISPNNGRSQQTKLSSKTILLTLCLLGIVPYWFIGAIGGYVIDKIPDRLGLILYLVHWSSVGGIIGFAISRKGIGGIIIGEIISAIVALVLMC